MKKNMFRNICVLGGLFLVLCIINEWTVPETPQQKEQRIVREVKQDVAACHADIFATRRSAAECLAEKGITE
jgi:hypothetical protein